MSRHRPLTVRIFKLSTKNGGLLTIASKHRQTSNLQQFPKPQQLPKFPRNPAVCSILFPPCRETDLPSHSPSPVRRHQHPYQSLRPQLQETLRHHERNQSRSGTDVQNPPATLRPCTQQNAVSSHFHGTTVLLYLKLFKSKLPINSSVSLQKKTNAPPIIYRKQQKLPLPPAKAATYIYKTGTNI